MVLLAGKGHETYQILKDRTIHFDDRETAREVLRSFGYREPGIRGENETSRCGGGGAMLGLTAESDAHGDRLERRFADAAARATCFSPCAGRIMTGTRMSPKCFEKGAVAAVVGREVEAMTGAVLRVEDSLAALCRHWPRRARREWGGDVVAVTGSAGKTTTKDVIAEMLADGDQDGEDRRQPE